MASWKKGIWGVGLAGAGVASAAWLASAKWKRETAAMLGVLRRARTVPQSVIVDFAQLDTLPAPVSHYFRTTLSEGQPMIRFARIAQAGLFRAHGSDGGWTPFSATETFSGQCPGFVWEARLQLTTLSRMRVRDSYLEGKGAMQARTMALVPLVNEHGKTELNASALQRYLAEAVWLPTALLPSAGVQWSAIDEHSARASLSDGDITVSLDFDFNEAGEITCVHTQDRYREEDGRYVQTPWEGRFHDYQRTHGFRIPHQVDAAWHLDGNTASYFKARIADIRYKLQEQPSEPA